MTPKHFDKEYMNDPEKSFYLEYLLTSGSGAYASSTISGCNTRKYHALLAVRQPHLDGNDHVIVSAMDEEVTLKGQSFALGTHMYPGAIHPSGYKFIDEFNGSPVPRWTYKLGDCIITKEILMPDNEDVLLMKYSVERSPEKIQLSFRPFLAFRNAHGINKANSFVHQCIQEVNNGISVQLNSDYVGAYIQTSQRAEFTAAPGWYYNFEYPLEYSRGHEYHEDLFMPGQFKVTLKEGDKFIISLGIKEAQTKTLSLRFANAYKKKPQLATAKDCLAHAARQFIVKQNDEVSIKAGYHWFGFWGRDKFISLPGLLLVTGHQKEFEKVIKSSLPELKNGMFPNVGTGEHAIYNTVDSSLWFIWAMQQYSAVTNAPTKVWRDYRNYFIEILQNYRDGTGYNIKMGRDGLISAGQKGVALTWMDAVIDGFAITPRIGKPVEINALWYNAVCFCLEIARGAGDNDFVKKWENLPNLIQQSFIATFWSEEKQYLADVAYDNTTDWSIRPNQVFAISLAYSPVLKQMKRPILNIVRDELLTSKGLRTLSPRDSEYRPCCEGDQYTRDHAYHQGTIWPWLLGHYADACLNTLGADGYDEVERVHKSCISMIGDICLYTIPEIYNAEYPHRPTGAVAQAWSVAEALRIEYLLKKYSDMKKPMVDEFVNN
jgi:predicted glycogen debranching enzyme